MRKTIIRKQFHFDLGMDLEDALATMVLDSSVPCKVLDEWLSSLDPKSIQQRRHLFPKVSDDSCYDCIFHLPLDHMMTTSPDDRALMLQKARMLSSHGIFCSLRTFSSHASTRRIRFFMCQGIPEHELGLTISSIYSAMSVTDQAAVNKVRLMRRLIQADLLQLFISLQSERFFASCNHDPEVQLELQVARLACALRHKTEHDVAQVLLQFQSLGALDSYKVALVNMINCERFAAVPILFRPLIDCESDFDGLLRAVLLFDSRIGVNVIYRKWNCNALHLLVYQKHKYVCEDTILEAATLLIEARINLNQLDSIGRTPLIQAASRGLLRVCSLLIENGADPYITDIHGSQFFDLLFYLRQRDAAKSGVEYTCLDLANFVDRYRILLTPDVQNDRKLCQKCRWLLVAPASSSKSLSCT